MEKAKALQLQVQTATFQKLESDLEADVTAIKEWVEKEKSRKASWQAMVLTHKRKRYVRGLAQVKKFSDDELAYRCADSITSSQELAGFRGRRIAPMSTYGGKSTFNTTVGSTRSSSITAIFFLLAGCNRSLGYRQSRLKRRKETEGPKYQSRSKSNALPLRPERLHSFCVKELGMRHKQQHKPKNTQQKPKTQTKQKHHNNHKREKSHP